jgi:hypothetical protein
MGTIDVPKYNGPAPTLQDENVNTEAPFLTEQYATPKQKAFYRIKLDMHNAVLRGMASGDGRCEISYRMDVSRQDSENRAHYLSTAMKNQFLNSNINYFNAWAKTRFRCKTAIYYDSITLDWSNHTWYVGQKKASARRAFKNSVDHVVSIVLEDVKDMHLHSLTKGIVFFGYNVHHYKLDGYVLSHSDYRVHSKRIYLEACTRLKKLGISTSLEWDDKKYLEWDDKKYWEHAIIRMQWPADWNSAPPPYTPDNL